MKKILTTVAISLLLTTIGSAQKLTADKVPAMVKAKFLALYPSVTNIKWEKENADYEAGFQTGSDKMTVVIDPQGKVKETETAIPVSSLPKAATDYLAAKYPGVKIAEAAKIIDVKGKVTYEAEVKKKDILFDEKGNFIK